ncbi:hypothetical protein T552_03530 [Pneumocystis carinii B80]|uniref:Nucleolar protein 58 n=1 Tax=Pneumocystis carinii (strain B80) TaxID=1408658 RepID=A0A0W4ZB76_PNEC8|nr:hypothetical protein T552_03530 [Pneumocystis carinii B80]KTW25670.1 hypothetical protein T552_03530 [Pneumocystis carinii B80]
MLVLTETSAGYAIFKFSAKEKIFKKPETLYKSLDTLDKATSLLKLKVFSRFENIMEALDNVSAINEGRVTGKLASLLSEFSGKKDSLIVSDSKLANSIKKLPDLNVSIIFDPSVQELYRVIREHITSLISELTPTDMSNMVLGLSHSLSRHKLKFSPDKVDTMIIQAIVLLDDLDKELNIYVMRIKEWYGWHFPEMSRIVLDNIVYVKVIKAMGYRTMAEETDFSEILPEDIEISLKGAAKVSMGTEITDDDLENINLLADQILSLAEYRVQLSEYLRNRMEVIAPNLTALVGELIGARLIAHAGSLLNLAKQPASTIQILGAEKALFRALKTKHDTPKYGLIYHSSLIGQASSRNKGKIARILATKAAISLRVDAMGEKDIATIGIENKLKVEARLRALEGERLEKLSTPSEKLWKKHQIQIAPKYNPDTDIVIDTDLKEDSLQVKMKKSSPEVNVTEDIKTESSKTKKKDKKDKSKSEKKRRMSEVENVPTTTESHDKSKRKKIKDKSHL